MATNALHKPQFYVEALRISEAGIAYPLIRAVCPEVSLDQWLIYVKHRANEGGFRALFDASGMPVGLFSYRLGERLRHGRVLALEDFVTFELSQAAPGRRALLAAAEELAKALGCKGLELRVGKRGLADDGTPKAAGWTSLGLALESIVFVMPLQDQQPHSASC